MTTFTIQTRDFNGRWKERRMQGRFGSLQIALDMACACDEDGIFPSDVRITRDGAVAVTHKSWMEKFHANDHRSPTADQFNTESAQ